MSVSKGTTIKVAMKTVWELIKRLFKRDYI